MKVLIVGGYGVFGERLARLLVRDEHEVCIAGRKIASAQTLARELGCAAALFDRTADLGALADFEVVVDAAGPFHSYGEDPYRLARAAIDVGVHYLDLSDNADFCAGIATLDTAAREAGVCVLSGLSSVPALSSAAVRALVGDETPRVIESAILPGNRSPRGRAVMSSILTQAGRSIPIWRGGEWCKASGWSNPRDYVLPDALVRQGWLIEVPDLRLFPAHFGADSVLFRAGLELGVMRYGLAAFAGLRRIWPFRVTGPLVQVVKFAAELLTPFGSGRGGMVVMAVVGQERRYWKLLAEEGDGPFIPAIATRALLRRTSLPVGARPALEAISLEEAEAALSGLKVRTERSCDLVESVFPKVLGADFEKLPSQVQATHLTADCSRWQGDARVRRGTGMASRIIGATFGFPDAADKIPVSVVKTVTATGETWVRRFGNRSFRSRLAATPAGVTESFGPFTFLLGLKVRNNALHYPVTSGKLGFLPLPRALMPTSVAREYVEKGVFHFDVKLLAPITQELLVHYQGTLTPTQRQTETPVPK